MRIHCKDQKTTLEIFHFKATMPREDPYARPSESSVQRFPLKKLLAQPTEPGSSLEFGDVSVFPVLPGIPMLEP